MNKKVNLWIYNKKSNKKKKKKKKKKEKIYYYISPCAIKYYRYL